MGKEQQRLERVDPLGATILPLTERAEAVALEVDSPTGHVRYERLRPLGKGGMGTVLEATDRQFGRVVALKEANVESPEARLRFSVEALVTANLEHPGVTAVYDRGVGPEGRPYYTMRRVHGRTLATAIAEASTVEARLKLVPVVVRVAQTLAYAHERGVIHRDVKPENIVVGRHGEAVVLDWGIAKVKGLATRDAPASSRELPVAVPSASQAGTRVGSVLGTPAYMAPEQAAGQVEEIDERTDVFALGALLYHVMTGRPPYDGPTLKSVMDQATEATAPAIASIAPGVPVAVTRVIERAMARSPAARYQTAAELATALEATMTDALSGERAGLARVAINTLMALGIVVVSATTAFVISMSSGFRDQGSVAWGLVWLFGIGTALIAIDWRTRGRHDLGALALVFVALTFFTALAGTGTNVDFVLHHLTRPEYQREADLWRRTLTEGMWEALGSLSMGLGFASIELVLWAVVQRLNRRQPAR